MSPILQSSLSYLGITVTPCQFGVTLSGHVGYRQAAAAIRLMRALGWARLGAGIWARNVRTSYTPIMGLPACGVVVLYV